MLGASRNSLAQVRESLTERAERTGVQGFDTLVEELFAVARLLSRESALRGLLADPGTAGRQKVSLLESLLSGKVAPLTLEVLGEVVEARWSSPRDLVDAVEILGFQAAFTLAENDGTLDAVEDELFRFSRIVEAQPTLRAVLTDPGLPADRKVAVVRDLLADKARPTTVRLLEQVIVDPRGRKVEDAVAQLSELAAERRKRLLAEVRVAAPLEPEQERRLAAALSRIYGREVQLQVAVDPTILGGVVVRVGDEVIDGSVMRRLEEARQRLVG
ncbi:F0F1 ATP synthase subunit delta [Carbonactinospora thermoautotrophica]|uniref:F0F1 ATP synthase subunit delta n=1 Tax=Carbonactinospora thermoautotrophica TaxID=1469144 RepID=UPI0022706B45|nr:F0F1 ATP synthase subunit delta [Carbonactinospora thermoautotrophica]MCX9191900.1 F0F1 ATP synthase subunit delta [Carbonactinospora thermoautotrophica]